MVVNKRRQDPAPSRRNDKVFALFRAMFYRAVQKWPDPRRTLSPDACLQDILKDCAAYFSVRRSDPAIAGQRNTWLFFNSLLHLKTNIENIAILDYIFFTLQVHLADGLKGVFITVFHEIGILEGLGPDKAALQIGMNHPGCFRCS